VRPVFAVIGRPEHIDSAPWVGRSDKWGGLRVGSAGHSLVHSALNGASVADLTNGRAWDRLPSGNGTLITLAVNGELAGDTVGLDEGEKHEGNKGEDGKEESLHCLFD